ncbi:MAG: PepSY domain-containing protein [Rhodospirillales bacterium]
MRVMPLNRRDLIRFASWMAAALVVASPAIADRNGEHDSARRAVELGEALPLVDVLAKVRSDLGGEIVGVSFERERDRWLYEFKVVEPSGRLVEVYVDAASGRVLKREAD